VNAEQLRQLAQVFMDEVEGARSGITTAETLRRISDRIFDMACDEGGEVEDEVDATGCFRVGDAVRAAAVLTHTDGRPSVAPTTLGVVAAVGGDDWVTIRFQGHARDWRCHVAEVVKA
jgi:exosome complex RNA-binding protein Csl4